MEHANRYHQQFKVYVAGKVGDPAGFRMQAPLAVIAAVFDLGQPAMDRVLNETKDGGHCQMWFNGRRYPMSGVAIIGPCNPIG